MKLNIDSQNGTVSGSVTVNHYEDASKLILTGKVDEVILTNPTNIDKNYLVIEFIKESVRKGYLVPPLITLNCKNRVIQRKFEKDIEEINNMWKTHSS